MRNGEHDDLAIPSTTYPGLKRILTFSRGMALLAISEIQRSPNESAEAREVSSFQGGGYRL